MLFRSGAVLTAPLPWVTEANGVQKRRRLLAALVKDDDDALLAAASTGGDLLQGVALALHFFPYVVVPRPFQGDLVVGGHGEVLLLDGQQPHLRLRLDEAGGSVGLIDDAGAACVPSSGVSCGSGLTGSNAGDLEEREPDDEDIPISILLGVQKLPRRREKAGGGG